MPAQEDKDKVDAKSGEDAGFLSFAPNPGSNLVDAVDHCCRGGHRGTGDSGSRRRPQHSGRLPLGTGMAPADPYAPKLAISGIQMSEATSFSGAKVTYIDGQITNSGDRTMTAITVQVGFHNDVGQFAQRLAVPLSLIRTREPYVDTQPVSAAPIEPGQTRDFRLIFDAVPADWNQQIPEIRVISVRSR